MTRHRRLFLTSLVAAWVGMVLACSGGVKTPDPMSERVAADEKAVTEAKADLAEAERADADAKAKATKPNATEEEKADAVRKTKIVKEKTEKLKAAEVKLAETKGEAARKNAEEERKKKEASAKAEEEIDANGLVLLKKTVQGNSDEFSTSITGTVVNRRSKKLGYAQITFNVYNANGAQVGTALANINGLEAGGKWDFKAVYFGADGKTYKFSELSGF